jgi:hypothetical protein
MEDYQFFHWDWVRVVVVYSLIVLTVSTAILIPALRLLNSQKLDRLPIWLRWVLVIPTAFIVGTVAELVPRFLFSLVEITINHELTFRPGFDSLTWQAYAPLFLSSAVS